MNVIKRTAAMAIAAGCLTAPRLAAHHGTTINYDRSKQWTAKAVVTEFKVRQPARAAVLRRDGRQGQRHALER
jgi:hypothetical protein